MISQSSNSLLRAFIMGACLVIILAGVKSAVQIVVPFLLSLFIAIICAPVVNIMTERKVPRGIAIGLLFVFILLIFFFLVGLINNTIQEFTASIPQYKQLLSRRINDILEVAKSFDFPLDISTDAIMSNFDPAVVMDFVSKLLMSFSGAVSNVFVLLLVVIFMLIEAPTAKHKLALSFSKVKGELAAHERNIDRILDGVIRYLWLKTIVSLITGICVWALLEVLGVQYAILWGTLSFLFNYIPNIGSVIAAVPIVIQALLLNGFSTGLITTAGVIGINTVIGNIIEPRLMGRTLGLSTLIVFLSLLFWGWLLGTVGMLLSVPLTMALKIGLESSPQTKRYAALLGEIIEEEEGSLEENNLKKAENQHDEATKEQIEQA
ncbi:hypothetical protein CVP05_07865 [Conservatibacter flavescens]|uniref:AI-2E family transporter n=1 Tax=Conservatibacter flavescens TaxID=28161 RepID=A0A2M8S1X7_9PAST|nr:AI-2E family transporter [Conservatibacter flavescens]PJG85162.1 hypothetical protein CVP05_07865 [Conservatibacter flavescens]